MLLRVLSYNVRSLRDDGDAVARAIRDAGAHVACIQEAPRFLRWRSKASSLARRSGMLVLTGGRPASGNLLLCSMDVATIGSWDVGLSAEPGLHQRGAAVALLSMAGARFAIAGTHLDLRSEPRMRHAQQLEDVLRAVIPSDVPTIIAGDMNDVAGSPVWDALALARVDAAAAVSDAPELTFSALSPRRRIDGIFVDPRIAVRSVSVLDTPDVRAGSDHRPVLAELEIQI